MASCYMTLSEIGRGGGLPVGEDFNHLWLANIWRTVARGSLDVQERDLLFLIFIPL